MQNEFGRCINRMSRASPQSDASPRGILRERTSESSPRPATGGYAARVCAPLRLEFRGLVTGAAPLAVRRAAVGLLAEDAWALERVVPAWCLSLPDQVLFPHPVGMAG